MAELLDHTTVRLTHIYGRSYFGSGGAWGGVDGENVAYEYDDNGFVYGVRKVRPADPNKPAWFHAEGGDFVGGIRRWKESGRYTPASGWEVTD